MIVHLHNTTKIVDINDVPARVWEGHTDGGVPVIAFITRLAADHGADLAEFTAELQEMSPPNFAVQSWPARMFID